MIYGIILGVHVVICVCLVLVVLMQAAKGGGLAGGSAFGGGAESTMFGGRGAATFLSKATTAFGAAFMVTSLGLTLLGSGRSTAPESAVTSEIGQTPLVPTAPPTTTALPPIPTGDGSAAPPSDAVPSADAPAQTPAADGGSATPPASGDGEGSETPGGSGP